MTVICARWKIEEDFQGAKDLTGLNQGQVTCRNSWMRWSLISLMAAAVLAITRSRTAAPAVGIALVPANRRAHARGMVT
ncbi:hypothetical protein ABZS79_35250 [Streptomyces griseoloalbus]|uniref:hypothetical protein n=1 Tax=Streptomyces griseoloalbus TaxID=67303 RepID=UPI0033A4ED14